MSNTPLQSARQEKGWSQRDVLQRFTATARRLDLSVPSPNSLKTQLSRWENGRIEVTEPGYQRVFREIYGRTNEELGFLAAEEDQSVLEFRQQLAVARSVDEGTVALFQAQLEQARKTDRTVGALASLEKLRSDMAEAQKLLQFSVPLAQQEALAVVLAQMGSLAGWQALDVGTPQQAWQHYETSVTAARMSGSVPVLAHTLAEQAYVLLEVGDTASAVTRMREARDLASRGAPELLRTWLSAAHGEALSAHGDRDGALRAFDEAQSLLPRDARDPALGYLMLNGGHLTRWRGNALAKLGDHDAIETLTDALDHQGDSTVRARTGLLLDLAQAHAATDDRTTAREYLRQARQIIKQIGSVRFRRRLSQIELPP